MSVTGDQKVLAALEKWRREMQAKAEQAMAEVMAALEGWAKSEHGYTDRTGNTTNSIRGEVAEVSATIIRGVLSAGMSYDVFLELARDGKWAFLMPTIERHKDDIFRIIEARLSAAAPVAGGTGPAAGVFSEVRSHTRKLKDGRVITVRSHLRSA